MIGQLIEGLNSAAQLSAEFINLTKDNQGVVAEIRSEIKQLVPQIRTLTRILVEGNGHKSIVSRVDGLEIAVEKLDGAIGRLEEGIGKLKKEEAAVTSTRMSSKATIIVAIITGIVSLGTSIIAIIVATGGKV